MSLNRNPIIGVTMGDAAGIGPEIIVKTLSLKQIKRICRPVVIGDAKVMEMAVRLLNSKLRIHSIDEISKARFALETIEVLDLNNILTDDLKIGQVQAMAGKASVEYVQKAVELALQGKIDAITTAPINKEAMNKAGFDYSGHTEILAQLTNTKDYAMVLQTGSLRVIHVTTHVSLRNACDLIKKDRVLKVIELANKAMLDIGIKEPRIAVSGLNPHAGEGGLFGREEIDEIVPAIEAAEERGINVKGPFPPDTVFLRTHNGEFDIAVAMCHDQGHIAAKMVGFATGVNFTVGLPIIRTSVDHGTAYRHAKLKPGTADPKSLTEAVKLAVNLAHRLKSSGRCTT